MKTGAYIPPHRRTSSITKEENEPSNANITTRLKQITLKEEEILSNFCQMFHDIFCINLLDRQDRWDSFCNGIIMSLGPRGTAVIRKIQRFPAVNGWEVMSKRRIDDKEEIPCQLEWDASKNAIYDPHIQSPMQKRLTHGEIGCAMSHVQLWKTFRNDFKDGYGSGSGQTRTMLILEDDASFYHHPPRNASIGKTFYTVFDSLQRQLPQDWDVLYLGFSDRGMRIMNSFDDNEEVIVFKPTYGFHTHAYALKHHAAQVYLDNLPVVGPLDVWLADNNWFDLTVYCGLVKDEGWKKTGANLISQRNHRNDSNVHKSGRER